MPYPAANLPLEPRPRGLGELAERAGGYGTWVVDMRWGLSPPHITGQPAPYGPTVVQTFYPRSQAPRLQALQTGGVIAAGTWPELLPAGSPVFRTPVIRPGVQQMSLPPGAGLTNGTALAAAGMSGIAGYGHIPLGVAQPPTELYERGVSGFGEDPAPGMRPDNITVLGKSLAITPADQEWLAQHASELQRIFLAWVRTYVARAQQVGYFNFVVANFGAVIPDYAQRRAHALQLAFGGPEGYHAAITDLDQIERVRKDLKAQFTADEIAAMPGALRQAFDVFVSRDAATSYAGYGGIPVLAGIALWKLAAIVGGLLVFGGGMYAIYAFSNVNAKQEMAAAVNNESKANLARANAEVTVANAIAQQVIPALSLQARAAPTPDERLAATQALGQVQQAWGALRQQNAATRAKAGSGMPIWMPVVGILGFVGLLAWYFSGWKGLKGWGRGAVGGATDTSHPGYGYGVAAGPQRAREESQPERVGLQVWPVKLLG